MVVRSLRPINSSAGLYPFPRGVAQYTMRPRYGSSFFFSMFFTVLTACSASPFAWRYLGLFVEWVKSYSFANWANSLDEKCGPLSEKSSCGTPCWAKMDLMCEITACCGSWNLYNLDITREVVDYEEVCCLFPLEQICSDFLPWIIRKVTWTQGFSMLILASTPTNNRSIESEILERYLRDFTCAHTELPALPASINASLSWMTLLDQMMLN